MCRFGCGNFCWNASNIRSAKPRKLRTEEAIQDDSAGLSPSMGSLASRLLGVTGETVYPKVLRDDPCKLWVNVNCG